SFSLPSSCCRILFYGPPIDLWGVGCILAGLLFKREPFFRGVNDRDQLRRVASVLGS
ncbi:cmgc ck2 protein kinase, partial [Nannochloropsis oceanica]